MGQTNSMSQDQTLMNDMSVTSPVSHVEMWPYVASAATYGDGAPSGPNYLLFSDSDRLPDSLWDRSKVGWSPTPHTPVLGAPQMALDPKLWGLGLQPETG